MTTEKRGAIVITIVVIVLIASAVVASASPLPARPRPPAPPARPAEPTTTTSTTVAPTTTTTTVPADGVVAVTITGGHDTDPADHGRPVVLIAAALGVPTEVFRTAFSGVTPAGPGSGGPTEAEARANKQALLEVLAPYGITNDRLDDVSDFYRYAPGRSGAIWTHTDATATATIVGGRVTRIDVTNAGAGYASAPTITVPGIAAQSFIATVVHGTDLATNGGIGAITEN
jgi:hypothetical protein